MTDLERAQAVLSKVSLARSPIKTMMVILAAARLEGVERAAEKAYANGFRRGEEAMRERAAGLCDLEVPWLVLGEDIRALPLTPEEPE